MISYHYSVFGLQVTINHEFIHSWQFGRFGYLMDSKEFDNYTEVSAYTYSNQFTRHKVWLDGYHYNGGLDIYNWPQLPSVYGLVK